MDDLAELAAFVAARLAEDEALARRGEVIFAVGWPDYQTFDSPELDDACSYLDRFGPARTLRQVEAVRAIAGLAGQATELDVLVDREYATQVRDLARDPWLGEILLRMLAAIWSDHPDYRPEWKFTAAS